MTDKEIAVFEKGFDGPTTKSYYTEGFENPMIFSHDLLPCIQTGEFLCPTLQMAIKWLEETHNILVVPDYVYECTSTSWVYKIYRLGENGKPERCVVKGTSYDENNNPTEHITGYRDYELSYEDYATREEAEDEGIRYVLEKYV